jgi:hypothetical protein
VDFRERLEDAIQRGERLGEARQRAQAQRTMNEEELKRLHSQYRLELSERIENCLRPLPQYFPGFRYETLVGDRGWGAAVSRDDLQLEAGKRTNLFSRLEMTVRPFSSRWPRRNWPPSRRWPTTGCWNTPSCTPPAPRASSSPRGEPRQATCRRFVPGLAARYLLKNWDRHLPTCVFVGIPTDELGASPVFQRLGR